MTRSSEATFIAGAANTGRLPRQPFRWPAEWELHSAVWLAWPIRPETWPGLFDRIPKAFAAFVAAAAEHEPVRLLVPDSDVAAQAVDLIRSCGNPAGKHPIQPVVMPYNDSWCRDYGPMFVERGGTRSAIAWRYNSWGEKYPPWQDDDAAAERMAESIGCAVHSAEFVLEGGALEGDGAGTILTTESCLLNPNRNGPVSKATVEQLLDAWVGANRILWIPGGGIEGDDTDGHVDQVARLVPGGRILVASPSTEDAPEAGALQANREALNKARNADGERFEVIPLPLPEPLYFDGYRLPASYCNYYVANGAVLVPVFECTADDPACRLLEEVFEGRQIVPVKARELAWGLGTLHCLSQQEPAGNEAQSLKV